METNPFHDESGALYWTVSFSREDKALERRVTMHIRYGGALLLLALTLVGAPLAAHEFLVKIASPNPKAGGEVVAFLLNTHIIIGPSEEITSLDEVEVMVRRGGENTLLRLIEDAASLATKAVGNNPTDQPSWLVAHRKPQLWSQTTEGMLQGDKDSLPDKRVLFTDKYEKFTKVLLNAAPADNEYSVAIGHLLELIPEMNPAGVRPGQEFRVKALLAGKATQAEFLAVRDGVRDGERSHDMKTVAAGPDGFSFTIDQPGFWVVIAKVTIPGEGGVRSHHINAALEFEIKQ